MKPHERPRIDDLRALSDEQKAGLAFLIAVAVFGSEESVKTACHKGRL